MSMRAVRWRLEPLDLSQHAHLTTLQGFAQANFKCHISIWPERTVVSGFVLRGEASGP